MHLHKYAYNMKPRNIAALVVIAVTVFVGRTFARPLDFFLLHTREVG